MLFRSPSASPAMVQKPLRRPAAKHRPMKPVTSLSRFFFLSSSSEVGKEEQSELLSRSLSCARKAFSRFLALYWKCFLSDSLSKRPPRSRLRCLWRRCSLLEPPSSWSGLLGAIGDEVVQIAAVVAPGVLLPLTVVVDALELTDEKAQVIVAQRLQLLI